MTFFFLHEPVKCRCVFFFFLLSRSGTGIDGCAVNSSSERYLVAETAGREGRMGVECSANASIASRRADARLTASNES